jgi:hypothetical protein
LDKNRIDTFTEVRKNEVQCLFLGRIFISNSNRKS